MAIFTRIVQLSAIVVLTANDFSQAKFVQEEFQGLQQECQDIILQGHTTYRGFHMDDPSMTLNEAMATFALNLSTTNLETGKTKHSPEGTPYGENLSYDSATGQLTRENVLEACRQATLSWYCEILDYDFDKAEAIGGKTVEHATQVLWKDANTLGCGYAVGTCKGAEKWWCIDITCDYNDGNWEGSYAANVLPVKSDKEADQRKATEACKQKKEKRRRR